ncbi:MAG: isochorismatase family protein, partial [Cyanobacteriota bacterium]
TIIPVNYQGEINLNSKQFILEKNVFDVFSNENTEKLLKKISPDKIFVFGVATDYCVEAAVLGLIRRYNNVSIITDAVKGIYEYKCYRFFEEAENLGITLSTTDELLKGKLCVLQ